MGCDQAFFWSLCGSLVCYNQAGQVEHEHVSVKVSVDPFLAKGWPKIYKKLHPEDDYGVGDTVFVDLNKDGKKEIVYVTNSQIFAWNVDGSMVTGFPAKLAENPFDGPFSEIAATGDIDGDGSPDIITNGRAQSGGLYAYDNKGILKKGFPLPMFQRDLATIIGIAIADLNQDGKDDIIALSSTVIDGKGEFSLHAYDGNGKVLLGWPKKYYPTVGFADDSKHLSIVDIDGNGAPEVIVPDSTSRNVFIVYNANGTLNREIKVKPSFQSSSLGFDHVFADFDGDGSYDVAVIERELVWNSRNASLHVVNIQGQELSGFPKPITQSSSILPTSLLPLDVNNDGAWELFVRTGEQTTVGYNGKGELVTPAAGLNLSAGQMVAAHLADKGPSLIAFDVKAYSTVTTKFDGSLSSSIYDLAGFWGQSLSADDLDGDGMIENVVSQFGLLFDGSGFLYMQKLPKATNAPESKYVWNTYAGNMQRTNSLPIRKAIPPSTWKRTVIFMYGQTQPGQDMFLRGGIDHAQRAGCTVTNFACAMPIKNRNLVNAATKAGRVADTYLDWYGLQAGQPTSAQGSSMDWTTNLWPSTWGASKSVAVDGYGVTPLNTWGQHYWMLDVDMDCSKGVIKDGVSWFELKSFISNGPGWEANVNQANTPYISGNHFAQCGKINVFKRGDNSALFLNFPQ